MKNERERERGRERVIRTDKCTRYIIYSYDIIYIITSTNIMKVPKSKSVIIIIIIIIII